jgi:hypothetical protein
MVSKKTVDDIHQLVCKTNPKTINYILIAVSGVLLLYGSTYIMNGMAKAVVSYKGLKNALKT